MNINKYFELVAGIFDTLLNKILIHGIFGEFL